MELRQLRYFVRVVELGGFSRAAQDLNLVQSALSQQVARLEAELCAKLLRRTWQGVTPTEAGLAFFAEAQLTLRHAEQAVRAAREPRLTGTVSVGLAPTTAAVLGLPLIAAMRERYPDVRLHLTESLSGHLSQMLNARQLDLAMLFETHPARRWSVTTLLEERLFLIRARRHLTEEVPAAGRIRLAQLKGLPLILPTKAHGLRGALDAAFARARFAPVLAAEIDSLAMLMDAVDSGFGATVQPGAAVARFADAEDRFVMNEISDRAARRVNSVCSLSDDELSPAAQAARVVLIACAREQVRLGRWAGAVLTAPEPARYQAP
ncbi:LysR family transcriptional regulator [Phenylobacterium immobile]|uniref:LysR family transcriptional regulator n=1 Tax=Phenylobacterium immobile TaxID=21 RepID=UPI000ACE0E40|nr:LysR family transcriptional regulator [Phenylobacterium immobile]